MKDAKESLKIVVTFLLYLSMVLLPIGLWCGSYGNLVQVGIGLVLFLVWIGISIVGVLRILAALFPEVLEKLIKALEL